MSCKATQKALLTQTGKIIKQFTFANPANVQPPCLSASQMGNENKALQAAILGTKNSNRRYPLGVF
jgi:hypothetical protein